MVSQTSLTESPEELGRSRPQVRVRDKASSNFNSILLSSEQVIL